MCPASQESWKMTPPYTSSPPTAHCSCSTHWAPQEELTPRWHRGQPSQGASFSPAPATCPTQPQAHSHRRWVPREARPEDTSSGWEGPSWAWGPAVRAASRPAARSSQAGTVWGSLSRLKTWIRKGQQLTSVLSSAPHITGRAPGSPPGPSSPQPPAPRGTTCFSHIRHRPCDLSRVGD